jgi:DNA primase catalytic core
MARIAADELEKLKTTIDLSRLVEAKGIALTKKGGDLVGLCPFHDDKGPSLVITPAKNLWHCFGCGAGGDVVQWVMKTEGVSFRHAVELLREGAPVGENTAKVATVRKLAPPISLDADDAALLGQVVAYYHRCLLEEPDALAYLVEKRGLTRAAIEHFKIGFCNRTLGLRLPMKNRNEGEAVRARLMKLGVLRESGHEHMRGRVTIPIVDDNGAVVGLYGRTITPNLRQGTPDHLYLPGPHRGVFNADGLKDTGHIVLCESLIDALTFWSAGFRNVTTSYGVEGFTDEMLSTFKRCHVERILVAYDRDDAGDAAAAKIIERLRGEGFTCARVLFPLGMDANSYALKVLPASKSLRLVVEKAVFEGHGTAAAAAKEEDSDSPPLAASAPAATTPALPTAPPPAPATTPALPTPAPAPAAGGPVVEQKGDDEVVISFGERRYRARGISKNLSHEVLRVNLFASRGEAFHVDTVDLYAAKQRGAFVQHAARELAVDVETVRRDVGRVLLVLEEKNDEAMKKTLEPSAPVTPELTAAEKQEAMALLTDKDVVGRVLADFEACGVVGERINKIVGLLAAISRKLDDPLAVVVQSSSAAGKSSLMEAVLAFVPDEEKVKYSAMTGQSLFYMAGDNLKHKVLAIVEEEGAERASYALKLLQSEKELTIASTGKDPQSGKMVTHEYRVEGPVMIFLTTTAIEVDEELLNRCLVLSVDEDREQTRAIHRLQRRRQTLSGLLAKEERTAIVKVHQNAQRLLRPLHVVNPFAEQLTFVDDKTRTRRDHVKYLTLIRAIALLHQHQRTLHTVQHRGQALEYIEATVDDVALANVLCHEVLGRTLDELPPQTRKLLELLDAMVARRCKEADVERSELRFTRREALDASGFGLTQLRLHLERLVELELVLVHRGMRGQSFVYELLWDRAVNQGGPHLAGLVDVDGIGGSGMTERWRGVLGELAGPWRPHGAPLAEPKRGAAVDVKPPETTRTPLTPAPKKSAPYRNGNAVVEAADVAADFGAAE